MSHSRTITAGLTIIIFSVFQHARALSVCEAWLENQVPVGPGKFLTATPGRLVAADQVARYNGSGSTDLAVKFQCVKDPS